MQTNLAENYTSSAEEIIERLRNGEEHLRGYLLENYRGYILSIVAKIIGKQAQSTDEFSVALQAFNEAIDRYDAEKNDSFLAFSGMVINRRIIDHVRKSSKFSSEYPFTYFEANDNEHYIEKIASQEPSVFTHKMEIQEEIMEFKNNLKSFGISFDDLVKLSPKHMDTKLMCVSVAKKLSENSNLSEKLLRDKKLPITEILTSFSLNRKTIENHRKFIIALFLIMKSDMEIIKGYIGFLVKGVQ